MKKKSSKTPFISLQIRELEKFERRALYIVRDILCGRVTRDIIGQIPSLLCANKNDHPLVLDKLIVDKIRKDHGNIIAENLVINVHDWDLGIRNVDKNPDKINLIKMIPNSNNYLVIGANRNNGFYLVTHFEVIPKSKNKLKRLLKRGDVLDRFGRTPSEKSDSLHINPSKKE